MKFKHTFSALIIICLSTVSFFAFTNSNEAITVQYGELKLIETKDFYELHYNIKFKDNIPNGSFILGIASIHTDVGVESQSMSHNGHLINSNGEYKGILKERKYIDSNLGSYASLIVTINDPDSNLIFRQSFFADLKPTENKYQLSSLASKN